MYRIVVIPLFALLGLSLLAGCGETPPPDRNTVPEQAAPRYSEELIRRHNRAVGLMGRFDYDDAHDLLETLHREHPAEPLFKVNLALATLNRQQPEDEASALALLEAVLTDHPDHPAARYNAALLHLRAGEAEKAAGYLEQVLTARPEDAYARYFYAQSLEQQRAFDAALSQYRQVIEVDGYQRSAYYGAFRLARRLEQPDARDYLKSYQQLADNPRARLVEYKYTRMGELAEVVPLPVAATPPGKPEGPLFSAPALVATLTPDSRRNAITAADINGDQRIDLFIAGAGSDQPNSVLLATDEGSYRNAPHPLTQVSGVNSALWGDLDNDGLLDVYLLRKGPNRLWHQHRPGQWRETQSAGVEGGMADSVDGALFDADHDGDLDIFVVNGDAPNELFNNNLDGSFRPLAEERGLEGSSIASRQVITFDYDNDRDADILVINQTPPHDLYLNDRLWAYRRADGPKGLLGTPATHAVAADLDADGHIELYLVDPAGHLQRRQQGDSTRLGTLSGELLSLWVQDFSGNGREELLVATTRGWKLYQVDAGSLNQVASGELKDAAGIVPLFADLTYGPSLVNLQRDGTLSLFRPGSGRSPFVNLMLSGREKEADSMRSNASGIGTRLALRNGGQWTLTTSFRRGSGPGQSLQPLSVGLNGGERLDFVSLTWSDGVFQTELALGSGTLHRISETQRQLSSCPVLFAWDGEKYTFVSDILGVGGMGYMVAPGEYAESRPWENFLLPEGLLKPDRGRFKIKVGEPMEEAAYIDALQLVAYDLPPGWDMVLDERMGISAPFPDGSAHFFRTEILPRKALDQRDEDVTSLVLRQDLKAPDVGPLDRRFIGRLAGRSVITLMFDQPLDSLPGEPRLVADGWVEYPYSQTMFGAWQARAGFEPPTLEARGRDGEWREIAPYFGYPAGMPRRMSLPLIGLPKETTALRLTTNQEVYWDRLSVVGVEPLPDSRRRVLPMAASHVADVGFARRTTGPQRQPFYDYQNRAPLWDTRHMAGHYTAFGVDTLPLLAGHDDAVAVIGPGEEVHVEFDQTPAPLQEGWTRRFVLESRGWAKDMDMFTRNGATLAPLPSSGKPRDVADRLHRQYNARYRSGH